MDQNSLSNDHKGANFKTMKDEDLALFFDKLVPDVFIPKNIESIVTAIDKRTGQVAIAYEQSIYVLNFEKCRLERLFIENEDPINRITYDPEKEHTLIVTKKREIFSIPTQRNLFQRDKVIYKKANDNEEFLPILGCNGEDIVYGTYNSKQETKKWFTIKMENSRSKGIHLSKNIEDLISFPENLDYKGYKYLASQISPDGRYIAWWYSFPQFFNNMPNTFSIKFNDKGNWREIVDPNLPDNTISTQYSIKIGEFSLLNSSFVFGTCKKRRGFPYLYPIKLFSFDEGKSSSRDTICKTVGLNSYPSKIYPSNNGKSILYNKGEREAGIYTPKKMDHDITKEGEVKINDIYLVNLIRVSTQAGDSALAAAQ